MKYSAASSRELFESVVKPESLAAIAVSGNRSGTQLRIDVALDADPLHLLDRRGGRPEPDTVEHVEDGSAGRWRPRRPSAM